MTDTSRANRARTLFTIVAVPLVLLGGLAAGAFWRLEQGVRKTGAELVAEAQALVAPRVVRPAHTDAPIAGTLAQTLEPLMPELLLLQKAEPSLEDPVAERCREVRDGKRPFAELPGECREALERGRPLMRRALLASRTREGGLPEGFGALEAPNHPYQRSGLVSLLHVLKLATFEMRSQLESGQADAALEHCLDGLALARDLGHGTGILGAMYSAAAYTNLFQPCAEALRNASPEGLQRATVALRRLREGLSPLSSAVRLERVRLPLLTFGRVLDDDQVAALPAGARALVEESRLDRLGPFDGPLHAPLLRRHAFIEVPRLQGRLTTLVDLPLEQREAPFRELGREVASSRNVFVRLSLSQPDFNQLGAMVDQQRAQADLLLALALVRAHRERSGTWPTALPSLFPERDVLLPTALTLQPGEAGTLVLVPEKASLQRLAAALGTGMALQGLSVVLRP